MSKHAQFRAQLEQNSVDLPQLNPSKFITKLILTDQLSNAQYIQNEQKKIMQELVTQDK